MPRYDPELSLTAVSTASYGRGSVPPKSHDRREWWIPGGYHIGSIVRGYTHQGAVG
jgi:hypothetical protein